MRWFAMRNILASGDRANRRIDTDRFVAGRAGRWASETNKQWGE